MFPMNSLLSIIWDIALPAHSLGRRLLFLLRLQEAVYQLGVVSAARIEGLSAPLGVTEYPAAAMT